MGGILLLALALLVLKVLAWRITGSQALLSDALESVVNVITGGFGLFSIWLATRPPDDSHPYGHGRVEFFAAGLQGAMILMASLGILREAIPAFLHPRALQQLDAGLLLSATAGVSNGLVGLYLVRRGRRQSSATLAGEGQHLLTDTVTTAGVILGLLLVRLTGWLVIDPIAATLVALSIAWSGFGLLRESADRLMDRADPVLLREIVAGLGDGRPPEWIEAHQLRAWSSGERVHVDVHLTMPRYWELSATHDAQRAMFHRLRARLGRPLELLVHLDPCQPSQCGLCSVEDCPLRATEVQTPAQWDVAALTGGPSGRQADPLPRW